MRKLESIIEIGLAETDSAKKAFFLNSSCANSWLLNILSEQPGGILQTVDR